MKPINLRIAEELGVREHQVAGAVSLLDSGATVPFVARYRKEATGALDDAQLRTLGRASGRHPREHQPARKTRRSAPASASDRGGRQQDAARGSLFALSAETADGSSN